jgi:hypothetical protein
MKATQTVPKKRAVNLPSYVGAGAGFVAFIALGAMPGLLYGGYMGLMMAGALFGTPVEPNAIARIITGGGMLLGLLASLFLFLVVGAVVGTSCGIVLRSLARVLANAAGTRTDDEEAPIKNHNRGDA